MRQTNINDAVRCAIKTGAFLLMSSAIAAQTTTTFKTHTLGESFQDWKTNENIQVQCDKPKRDDKATCKRLGDIGSGAEDTFSTTDGKQARTFWFNAGKMTQVQMTLPLIGTDYTEQVGFLTQKYGSPTKTSTNTYQNAIGAHWDCGEAEWIMPDGGLIMAHESIDNNPYVGVVRNLELTWMSKERIDELAAAHKAQPNPY
jgi:hypothetical protein